MKSRGEREAREAREALIREHAQAYVSEKKIAAYEAEAVREAIVKSILLRDDYADFATACWKFEKYSADKAKAEALEQALSDLKSKSITRVIENQVVGLSTYHNDRHAEEMYSDISGLIGKLAGANHDVIQGKQGKKPLQVEEESALLNEKDLQKWLSELNILTENELEVFSKLCSRAIVDGTYLVGGQYPLMDAIEQVEERLFQVKIKAVDDPENLELQVRLNELRNEKLKKYDALTGRLAFYDINRSLSESVVNDATYQKNFGGVLDRFQFAHPDQKKFTSSLEEQMTIVEVNPKGHNMRLGQMMSMFNEIYNRYCRVDGEQVCCLNDKLKAHFQSKIGDILKNFKVDLGVQSGVLSQLSRDLEHPKAEDPAISIRRALEPLLSRFQENKALSGALRELAYLFPTPKDQKAYRQLVHELRMFSYSGKSVYQENYRALSLKNTHLIEIFLNASKNELVSNDVGFALNRDLYYTQDQQTRRGLDYLPPMDSLGWVKTAILIDRKRGMKKLKEMMAAVEAEKNIFSLALATSKSSEVKNAKEKSNRLASDLHTMLPLNRVTGRIEAQTGQFLENLEAAQNLSKPVVEKRLRILDERLQAMKDLEANVLFKKPETLSELFQSCQGVVEKKEAFLTHILLHAALKQGHFFRMNRMSKEQALSQQEALEKVFKQLPPEEADKRVLIEDNIKELKEIILGMGRREHRVQKAPSYASLFPPILKGNLEKTDEPLLKPLCPKEMGEFSLCDPNLSRVKGSKPSSLLIAPGRLPSLNKKQWRNQ